MNKNIAWLGLSKIEGICHKQMEILLQVYKTPENIIKARSEDLRKYGLTEEQSKQINEITEEKLRRRSRKAKKRKSIFYNNR